MELLQAIFQDEELLWDLTVTLILIIGFGVFLGKLMFEAMMGIPVLLEYFDKKTKAKKEGSL